MDLLACKVWRKLSECICKDKNVVLASGFHVPLKAVMEITVEARDERMATRLEIVVYERASRLQDKGVAIIVREIFDAMYQTCDFRG